MHNRFDPSKAAALANKTMIMLDSSQMTSCESFADRHVFQIDAARWDAFTTALAHPPKNNTGLRRLLEHKPASDKVQ